MNILLLFPIIIFLTLISSQSATYHVDSINGNDINNGITQTTAWKTLGKINSITFQPGDIILFKAGSSWAGTLSLRGSGTQSNPIRVDRYGDGPKPLFQGEGKVVNTIELIDVSYWEISNLEITNKGDPNNYHNGLLVSSTSSQRYHHFYVKNLDINNVDCKSNSGGGGIRMDGVFSDILIDGCVIHHIGGNGIDVHSNYAWIVPKVQSTYDQMASEDVVIQNCTVSFCGDSGIWIWGAKRPIIQYCTAHDCNLDPTSGWYVGIWIMDTEDAIIQHNNSYRHRKSWDGECIDVDVLCFRTIVQYNYVHDNDYIGIIVYGYTKNNEVLNTDNVVIRYNIAERCKDGSFSIAGDKLSNTYWYNNTSYSASPNDDHITGVPYNGIVGNNHYFSNNIFYGGDFDFDKFGNANIEFSNNCYFNTTQDRPNDPKAILSDPKLVNVGSGTDGYHIFSDSPCIDAGATVSAGNVDFWGNLAPVGNSRDIGVHEFNLGGPSESPLPPSNLRVIK